MNEKIVFTVPGLKLFKDLQTELSEETFLETRYHPKTSSPIINQLLPSQLLKKTIFGDLNSPKQLHISQSQNNPENLTISMLKKPKTAISIDRIRNLTINSNFSTRNFQQTIETPQEPNISVLSRMALRNSIKTKETIDVNKSRFAMVPAGSTKIPELKKKVSNFPESDWEKRLMIRLRHDEAKLEKILANCHMKKGEILEVKKEIEKKMKEKSEALREYFNKKDAFWRDFFETKKIIENNELCKDNYEKRRQNRILEFLDHKYRNNWNHISVGNHNKGSEKLIFGRKDLIKFENMIKNMHILPEIEINNENGIKRSKTNISKFSDDIKL